MLILPGDVHLFSVCELLFDMILWAQNEPYKHQGKEVSGGEFWYILFTPCDQWPSTPTPRATGPLCKKN